MDVKFQVGPLLKWAAIGLGVFLLGEAILWLTGPQLTDVDFFGVIMVLFGLGLMITTIITAFVREVFPEKEEKSRW
jgi:hypothetical protein